MRYCFICCCGGAFFDFIRCNLIWKSVTVKVLFSFARSRGSGCLNWLRVSLSLSTCIRFVAARSLFFAGCCCGGFATTASSLKAVMACQRSFSSAIEAPLTRSKRSSTSLTSFRTPLTVRFRLLATPRFPAEAGNPYQPRLLLQLPRLCQTLWPSKPPRQCAA